MSKILTDEDLEKYISEITTGLRPVVVFCKHRVEKRIILRNPSSHERRIANIKYEDALKKAIEDGIRTHKQINSDFIIKNNLFTDDDSKKASGILSQIEVLRKQIDLARTEYQKETYQKRLKEEENKYYLLVENKIRYESMSAEMLADRERFNYYSFCCALDFDTLEPVWKTYKEFIDDEDAIFRGSVRVSIREFIYGYESSILRAVARSGQWKAIWSICIKTGTQLFGMEIPGRTGGTLFSGPASSWSYSQIQLANWSIFYDNILQSSNPPPNSVVKNDALLDKWVEREIDKQERERRKYSGDSGNAYDHSDVIVLDAETQELMFDENGELRG